jgi:pantoate--beta-alanine ligase
MIIFKTAADINNYLKDVSTSETIGFVPTMGALHEGHLSLIRKAKANKHYTVCSIFVNPTQFNDKNDFEKYPSTIDNDIAFLIENECDVLFLPSVEEIYPEGMEIAQHFELGHLNSILEGRFRKGHFNGVAQVVSRLLQIVQPQHLYLGQKDFQQCMVIKRLLETDGKEHEIQLHICPTLREQDGLAMSSRNTRLNNAQRKLAGVIYQ